MPENSVKKIFPAFKNFKMRTLVIAIVCGFLGYQFGKSVSSDMSNFIVEKKTKISDTTEEVLYLKITSTGQISFVSDKTEATLFSNNSAKNAVEFLLSIYQDSSIKLLSA
ncbi:hypothetical protein EBZ38_05475 [bacterium]|nr:hypothetical protein [bacterium]